MIGALGAGGLARVADRCRDRRARRWRRRPAIWREGELVAAPVARPEPDLRFRRVSAVPPPWEAKGARI